MTKRDAKNMLLKLLSLLLVLVLITSCKNKESKETGMDSSLALTTSKKRVTGWPKPDSYVGDIPVYDKFESLQPLFQFNNDTTYVVNFWATWCKPCIKELPYFEEFHSSSKNKKVKVVLVSLDFPKQVESKLVPFVQKRQLKSKVIVLLDGNYNDWIDKVSPDWSGAIPATYIYKGGKNHLVADPFENLEELSQVVNPFL